MVKVNLRVLLWTSYKFFSFQIKADTNNADRQGFSNRLPNLIMVTIHPYEQRLEKPQTPRYSEWAHLYKSLIKFKN